MGNNLLEFALGLQVDSFLQKIGLSEGAVFGLVGTFELAAKTFEKAFGAMERGAALKGIATTLGVSVSRLYELQEGLGAVGMEGASVDRLLLVMQKSLSGVNEAGERTEVTFSRLGLDIAKLRNQDTIKSITDVAAALAKISPNQATGIAESIFGRFNAEQVLAISRNLTEFQRGMRESAETGALLQRFGDVFRQVVNDTHEISNDILGIWVAIGGELGPSLHKAFGWVHDEIKHWGTDIIAIMHAANWGELLKLGAEAAFEQIEIQAKAAFLSATVFFGEVLATTLQSVFLHIGPMIATAIANAGAIDAASWKIQGDKKEQDRDKGMLNRINQIPDDAWFDHYDARGNPVNAKGKIIQNFDKSFPFDQFQGMSKSQAQGKVRGQIDSANQDIQTQQGTILGLGNQIAETAKKDMMDALKSIWDSATQAAKDAKDAYLGSTKNAPHPLTDKFNKAMDDAKKKIGAILDGAQPLGAQDKDFQVNHYKMEFTSLEKMGFVMKTGGGAYDAMKVDLLRKIVENTAALHPSNMDGIPVTAAPGSYRSYGPGTHNI